MVRLKVPIGVSLSWPWFDGDIDAVIGPESQIHYDGGEEEGAFEVFDFHGASRDEVAGVVRRVLDRRRIRDAAVVNDGTDDLAVSVRRSAVWLQPIHATGGTRYERALKRVCKDLSTDPVWMTWWDNATDFTELAFHIKLPPGQWKVRADPQNPSMLIVYAPVLRSGLFEEADLTSAEAKAAATEHVRQIIEAVRHQYELPDPPRIRQA